MERSHMQYTVNIIIEKDDDGYYAYCPELKGCQSQGDTIEAAKANIQEAVELYLETLSKAEKQALLKRETMAMTLEVQVA
jgi:predicted RNase H-like HicB family nuclease